VIALGNAEIIAIDELKGTDKVAEVNPLMSDRELEALTLDIQDRGLLEPIYIHRYKIVDGRHRVKALKALGATEIKAIKLPHKISVVDKAMLVRTKETRRMQSSTQLACTAVNVWNTNKPDGIIQKDFIKKYGVSQANFTNAQWLYKNNKKVFTALKEGFQVQVDDTDKHKTSDSLNTVVKYLKQKEVAILTKEVEYVGLDVVTKDINDTVNYHVNALIRDLNRMNISDSDKAAYSKDIATQLYSMFMQKTNAKDDCGRITKGKLEYEEETTNELD